MRVRVKICGLTSPDLAIAACDAGADAIGMVFYPPSSRNLDWESAAEIAQSVRPFVSKVVVMVNPDERYVQKIIDCVHPHLLQFHGDEEPDFCRRFDIPFIKAIRVKPGEDISMQLQAYTDASAMLLDTWNADHYGGTGKPFDWSDVHINSDKPVILAGGLNPNNVISALHLMRPWAVDVSSGVEVDGRKNEAAMNEFCRQVARFNSKENPARIF